METENSYENKQQKNQVIFNNSFSLIPNDSDCRCQYLPILEEVCDKRLCSSIALHRDTASADSAKVTEADLMALNVELLNHHIAYISHLRLYYLEKLKIALEAHVLRILN